MNVRFAFSFVPVIAAVLVVAAGCGLVAPTGTDSEGACGISGCSGPCATSDRCIAKKDAGPVDECGPSGCEGPCGTLPKCDKKPPPPPVYDLSVCSGGVYAPLEGLSLAKPVDYLELRDEVNPEDIMGGTGGGLEYSVALASSGELCKTASDAEACARTFRALRAKTGWRREHSGGAYRPASHEYVVYTAGDTIGVVTTKMELDALLGTAINLKEAALYVTLHLGHSLDCKRPHARIDGAGYHFFTRSGSTCGEGIRENEDYVAPNAVVQTVSTRLVEPGQPCP